MYQESKLFKTARATTIVTVLFLCPSPSKGMELCLSESSSDEGFGINPRFYNNNVNLCKTINENLIAIVGVLESKLNTDSHKIKSVKDGTEMYQCKLSALTSSLVSGDCNKLLRDDLRNLLYKPWTDPHYRKHLSQKDFTLLMILKEAIDKEAAFKGKDQVISSLETL
jgi:hypothetical protein